MKSRPMAAEKFHADSRQTHEEANKRFSQFCERTSNSNSILLVTIRQESVADALTFTHGRSFIHTNARLCMRV